MAVSRSLGELTALVSGELRGNPALEISGIGDLRNAGPDQLSFLANSKYFQAAKSSRAGAILVSTGVTEVFSSSVIYVTNPSAAFGMVAALFAPEPLPVRSGIHPTAVILDGVELGENVYVGPGAVLEAGVKLGDHSSVGANCYLGHEVTVGSGCIFYPNVTVRERCRIGNRVILHSGAVIGSDGFGYEFQNGQFVKIPQQGYVQIDDEAEIGSNTTIDRGRFDRTWIQQGAKIDNLVMIAHNCVVGKHSVIVAQTGLSGSSSTGAYVTLAGHVGTVGHIHIGDQATVTAKSGVTKDIPAKQVYRGAPARPIKESMELEVLYHRLPELFKRIRALEKELAAAKAKA